MSDQTVPYYIQRKAGDPWTVEDFLDLQKMIKDDIQGSITTAIDALDQVDNAGDSAKFGGQTPDEYAKAIVDRVMAQLPKRTGYRMLFKKLEVGEPSVVEHKLSAFPLVDVYELDYFRVIASEDDHIYESLTSFYLYHSSESRIRYRPEELGNPASVSVEIDPDGTPPYRVPFQTMLELYNVEYDENSSLGDIENDFWKAFFDDPNDRFDDDQYCHSPWFDRCCREMRTLQYLKQRKEWDDIWLQVRPRKTINFHSALGRDNQIIDPVWAPNKIQVVHFGLDSLGLTLLDKPDLSPAVVNPKPLSEGFPIPDPIKPDHLKVMVLLKV